MGQVKATQPFKGKVSDVQRRTVGGFARGTAVIEGLDSCSGQQCHLDFQNENLIATSNGQVLASVPDLITSLDAESGEPITTETLRYGMRLVILGMPCDAQWRSEAGLALVGPQYFGYSVPFVPVESRFPPQSVGVELAGAP